VSDGVQSLVTARYPEAIFSAIETTGDGAVNAQSRIQMDLFKARRVATDEYRAVLASTGLSAEEVERRAHVRQQTAVEYPSHVLATTASNELLSLVPALRRRIRRSLAAVAASGSPVVESLGRGTRPRLRFVDGKLPLAPVSADLPGEARL
jgi:hypothetical protein